MLKENRKHQGFTIVEVLIVLAIAGMILLIVLLAVPALQRNARNTTLKDDVAALSGAVNEFKANNDGAAPTTLSLTGATGGAGTSAAAAKLSGGASVTATATPASGDIGYVIGAACPGVSGNSKSVAIYYTPEATTTVTKCVDA